jgi:hypothetical protein
MVKKQTEVAVVSDNLVGLYDTTGMDADALAQLAAEAKDVAAQERPSVSRIGLKSGILSYNGGQVEGNKLKVVTVLSSAINTYYTGGFDPDKPSSPTCYALSSMDDSADMVPHPDVTHPQSDKCSTCPKFKWGSDIDKDGKVRKGKACKESRRIVMLPADCLDSVEDVKGAELAMMKLPVTSVKAWGGFVNGLSATVNLPPHAVVTELTTVPDLKTQFKVVLTPVARIANKEIIEAVKSRFEMAALVAMESYGETDGESDVAPDGTKLPEKF